MIPYIFKYYITSILFLVIFFLLGEGFRKIANINSSKKYEYIFLNLFIGIVVFITLVSLWYTAGRTIFLGNVILVGFYFLYRKKDFSVVKNDFDLTKRYFAWFLIESSILVLAFFVFKYIEVENISNFPNWHNQDSVFSSKVAKYLLDSGSENYAFDYIFKSVKSPSPYHYFDIWYTSGIANITGLNYFHTLQLVVHTSAFLIICLGMFAVLEVKITSIKIYHKLILLSIILFCGIYLNFFVNIPLLKESGFVYVRTLVNLQKNFISYLFLIASLLMYFKKNYLVTLLVLLSLTLSQISTLPTLMISIVLMLLLVFILTKEKIYISYLIPVFSIAIFVALFYTLGKTTNSETAHTDNLSPEKIVSLFSVEFVFKVFKVSAGEVIRIISVYIYNILLLAYLGVRYFNQVRHLFFRYKVLIFSVFMILVVSLTIADTAIYFMMDAMQFFSNISIPLINIILVLIYAYFIDKINLYEKLFICILIAITIFFAPKRYSSPGYSEKFKEETYQLFTKLNPIGVCMISNSDYIRVHDYSYPEFGVLGHHLCIWNKDAHTIQLTVFEAPKEKNEYPNKVKTSTFYRFVQNEKDKRKFISIEQSQLNFIDQYKIDYMLTSHDFILSDLVKQRIKKEIVDENSGEKFYLLKHK